MDRTSAVEWHSQHASAFDSQYENQNNFKERFEIWAEFINRYSHRDYSVLDVGCGSGIFTFHAAKKNKSVIGIDGSPEMLEISQKKKEESQEHKAAFIHHDIQTLPSHLHNQFDLILCSSVLEYLDNIHDSLKAITSFLKNHGTIIFSLPNAASFFRKVQPTMFRWTGHPSYYPHIKTVLTIKETERLLHSLGFTIKECAFYARTPVLSEIFRRLGLSQHSDNLFIVAAQKK